MALQLTTYTGIRLNTLVTFEAQQLGGASPGVPLLLHDVGQWWDHYVAPTSGDQQHPEMQPSRRSSMLSCTSSRSLSSSVADSSHDSTNSSHLGSSRLNKSVTIPSSEEEWVERAQTELQAFVKKGKYLKKMQKYASHVYKAAAKRRRSSLLSLSRSGETSLINNNNTNNTSNASIPAGGGVNNASMGSAANAAAAFVGVDDLVFSSVLRDLVGEGLGGKKGGGFTLKFWKKKKKYDVQDVDKMATRLLWFIKLFLKGLPEPLIPPACGQQLESALQANHADDDQGHQVAVFTDFMRSCVHMHSVASYTTYYYIEGLLKRAHHVHAPDADVSKDIVKAILGENMPLAAAVLESQLIVSDTPSSRGPEAANDSAQEQREASRTMNEGVSETVPASSASAPRVKPELTSPHKQQPHPDEATPQKAKLGTAAAAAAGGPPPLAPTPNAKVPPVKQMPQIKVLRVRPTASTSSDSSDDDDDDEHSQSPPEVQSTKMRPAPLALPTRSLSTSVTTISEYDEEERDENALLAAVDDCPPITHQDEVDTATSDSQLAAGEAAARPLKGKMMMMQGAFSDTTTTTSSSLRATPEVEVKRVVETAVPTMMTMRPPSAEDDDDDDTSSIPTESDEQPLKIKPTARVVADTADETPRRAAGKMMHSSDTDTVTTATTDSSRCAAVHVADEKKAVPTAGPTAAAGRSALGEARAVSRRPAASHAKAPMAAATATTTSMVQPARRMVMGGIVFSSDDTTSSDDNHNDDDAHGAANDDDDKVLERVAAAPALDGNIISDPSSSASSSLSASTIDVEDAPVDFQGVPEEAPLAVPATATGSQSNRSSSNPPQASTVATVMPADDQSVPSMPSTSQATPPKTAGEGSPSSGREELEHVQHDASSESSVESKHEGGHREDNHEHLGSNTPTRTDVPQIAQGMRLVEDDDDTQSSTATTTTTSSMKNTAAAGTAGGGSAAVSYEDAIGSNPPPRAPSAALAMNGATTAVDAARSPSDEPQPARLSASTTIAAWPRLQLPSPSVSPPQDEETGQQQQPLRQTSRERPSPEVGLTATAEDDITLHASHDTSSRRGASRVLTHTSDQQQQTATVPVHEVPPLNQSAAWQSEQSIATTSGASKLGPQSRYSALQAAKRSFIMSTEEGLPPVSHLCSRVSPNLHNNNSRNAGQLSSTQRSVAVAAATASTSAATTLVASTPDAAFGTAPTISSSTDTAAPPPSAALLDIIMDIQSGCSAADAQRRLQALVQGTLAKSTQTSNIIINNNRSTISMLHDSDGPLLGRRTNSPSRGRQETEAAEAFDANNNNNNNNATASKALRDDVNALKTMLLNREKELDLHDKDRDVHLQEVLARCTELERGQLKQEKARRYADAQLADLGYQLERNKEDQMRLRMQLSAAQSQNQHLRDALLQGH